MKEVQGESLRSTALIEAVILACLERNPVDFRNVEEQEVKRVQAAIKRAITPKGAAFRDPVTRKHFLCGCFDFTGRLPEEHLIVGYGYSSGRTTAIERVHHVAGEQPRVVVPDCIRADIRRHHPLIASKVYPAFLRGEYDTAVFQAFREVEVTVRDAGKFGTNDYGTDLMRAAFRPAAKNNQPLVPGALTDAQLPTAEQEAMANLFAGAISLYINPQSHRHVPTHAEDAAEVIVFASQLLRLVDRLRP